LRVFLYGLSMVVLLFFVSLIPVISEKIEFMLDRQKTQVLTNEDYIRVVQYKYFTSEHFKAPVDAIFGSGVPDLRANNNYSNEMNDLLVRGITWVDFGLLSISWIIGVPTVILMIVYALKAIF